MKRGFTVLACMCALAGGGYFAVSKWGIRHETLNLFDEARQRPVAVDLAVRGDYEMKANAGYWKLPVAIISNGNTVKNTEYSFLANVLAARGYLVASIQQDLPTDPPLVTKVGLPYVGRLDVYKKGEANILFVLGKLKQAATQCRLRSSDAGRTFQWRRHRDVLRQATSRAGIEGDHARQSARAVRAQRQMKILSFRSKDPNFKTDPGVLPSPEQAKADGINIVDTQFQHTDMSDRGPYSVKERSRRRSMSS